MGQCTDLFWLHPETLVLSWDYREGRVKMKISKLSYLSIQLNAIGNNNNAEQNVTFEKTGKNKNLSYGTETSLHKM